MRVTETMFTSRFLVALLDKGPVAVRVGLVGSDLLVHDRAVLHIVVIAHLENSYFFYQSL